MTGWISASSAGTAGAWLLAQHAPWYVPLAAVVLLCVPMVVHEVLRYRLIKIALLKAPDSLIKIALLKAPDSATVDVIRAGFRAGPE